MDWIKELRDSKYTASFQRRCGAVSFGRVVVDNNNSQDGVSKFTAARVNGVKNGYHHTNGIKTRLVKSSDENDIQLTNGHVNGVDSEKCKHKLLTTSDGVQYAILNKPLYFLFRLGALMGNEEFFVVFFSFMLWNVDSVIARQSVLLWCVTMYLGQAAKDVIRWPRPSSPPVIRLETEHSGEHGMPSTHAMAGTVIPCTVFTLVHDRYEISPQVCIAVAVIWTVVVCLSRLYLGVHSVSDVLCGSGSAVLLLVSLLPYIGKCDWYIQTHPSAPFVVFVVSIAMCTVLYPTAKGHSSRANATQICSSASGWLISGWFMHNIGVTHVVLTPTGPYPLVAPTLEWLALSVARVAVGFFIIGTCHLFASKFTAWVLSYMMGLEKTDKRHPSVVIPYKFITYFTLGMLVSGPIPVLYRYLGICRTGFLQEVL